MTHARLRSLGALTALAVLAGCSLFRDGDERPLEASLNGDDSGLAGLVEAVAGGAPPVQAPPPSYAMTVPETTPAMPTQAAAPTQSAPTQSAAPGLEPRSVLFALHLASYRNESSAAAGWRIIAAEAPETLDDLHPRIETVDLGPERGVYLRLKAGPIDSRAEAAARCAALVDAGHYCQAVDFEGREISG
jgi:hypothetical protein